MLFSFLLTEAEEVPLRDINFETVEAESQAEAIKVYILSDNTKTGYVSIFISNIIKYYEDVSDETLEIAIRLSKEYKKLTKIRIGDTAVGYKLNKEDRQVVPEKYQQFIDNNLDEIAELMDDFSSGEDYFRIIKIDVILTTPRIKSTTKR